MIRRIIEDHVLGTGYWVLGTLIRCPSRSSPGELVVQTQGAPAQAPYVCRQARIGLEKTKSHRQLQLAVELGQRAENDAKEASQFVWPTSSCTLGDVRAHRDRSSPKLSRQAVPLLPRQAGRDSIYTYRKVHRVAPDSKTPEVMHVGVPTNASVAVQVPSTKYQVLATRRLFT